MDPGHSDVSPVTAPALESEQLSVLFLFLTESLELSKQLTRNIYRDLGRVIQQTDKNDSLGRTLVNFNERNGAHSRIFVFDRVPGTVEAIDSECYITTHRHCNKRGF